MKSVAVFFDKPGENDYPLSIELYRTVYRELAEKVANCSGSLSIVRSMDTYRGGKTFSHAWCFQAGALVYREGPLTFDLIWNKGHFHADADCNVINDPELDELCTNKWKTYQRFPKEHPATVLVHSREELSRALRSMQASMIVAKPLDLEGGTGIFIGSPDLIRSSVASFPYLLQEFVDTSQGIPGIVDGMHDLRIICLAGSPSLCYIRTPPPGEMTANVSRGGREIEVPPSAIPAGALKLFLAVDAAIERFIRRLYSIDMGLDHDDCWRLFELNSRPGFSPMETGPSYRNFYQQLAQFLITSCQA